MRILLFLLICLEFYALAGQNTDHFRHYSIENGLVNNNVNGVFQDSKGYLWFCTDGGVSRFDGYAMTNFTTKEGLPDNVIQLALEDSLGRIWFAGLANQLSYFEKGEIHPYVFNKELAALEIPPTYKLSFELTGDTLKLGTLDHGYIEASFSGFVKNYMKPEGTVFREHFLHYSVPLTPPIDSTLDINGKKYKYEFNNYAGKGFVRIRSFDDLIYVSDGGRLFRITGDTLERLIFIKNFIYDYFIDSESGVYFNLFKNGTMFIPSIDQINSTQVIFPEILSHGTFKDLEGNIWLSTQGEGVFVIPGGNIEIPHQLVTNKLEYSVKNILFTKDSNVVINYGDSLSVLYERNNQQLTTRRLPAKERKKYNYLYSLKDGSVISSEEIWHVFHSEIERLGIHDEMCPKKLEHFTTIFEVGANDYWLSVMTKGFFHIRNDSLVDYQTQIETSSFLHQDNYPYAHNAFYVSHESEIYFSPLNNGLCQIKGSNITALHNSFPMLNDVINEIKVLDSETMMLSTTNHGVVIMKGDSVYSISEQDGLSDNSVNTVYKDENGNLWVGTSNGLNLIDLENTLSVSQVITTNLGLPSNHITAINGRGIELWVGTSKGLVVLDRTKIKPNTVPPFMHITGFKVDEVDTTLLDHYEFAHDQNYFVINYTGIAFKNAGNLDYEYQLEGLDKKWLQTKTRSVRYNKLDPGNYTFRVKAANEDGYWSDTASMSFTILPPYWQTWWFRLSALSLLALALFTVIRYRFNQLKAKSEYDKQLIRSELKALRAQMNPHFTFNTLNAIQRFILEKDSMGANDFLAKFSRLMRRVLENSEHAWISLDNELETLRLYLEIECLRFENKLSYTLDIAPDLPLGLLEVPPTLIQPYVENAILHGVLHKKGSGTVAIGISQKGNLLHCLITDDGVGRELSREIENRDPSKGKSYGMSITAHRLELLQANDNVNFKVDVTDLKDEAGRPTGTKVEIFIPFREKAFTDESHRS